MSVKQVNCNSFKNGSSNKLFISNIPLAVQFEEVNRIISDVAAVTDLEQGSVKSDTEYSVIASFETEEDAKLAYEKLHGQTVEGSELKVEFYMEQHRPNRVVNRNSRGTFRPPNFSGGSASPMRTTDFPLRILVLSDMVGAIIGRSGGTIRQITQQSRARVDVHRKENAGALEKIITVYGNPDNCSLACQKILEVMQQEANNTNRGEIPLKILAHNNLIGRIIGKNGNTIKRIMEQTDTKITVSSSIHDVNSFNLERIITIKGSLENICKAESIISGKLRQCYESDLAAIAPQALMFPGLHPMAMMSTLNTPGYSAPPPRSGPSTAGPYGIYNAPNYSIPPVMGYPPGSSGPPVNTSSSALTAGFQAVQGDPTKETVNLYIPNSAVGAIIGTGGSTIRDMISSSGASIKVAQPGKDEPQLDRQGERKVTIIGNPESQWKAQFMIFRKVGYEGFAGPQEATLRVEIMVPSNQVGRIIGKGGTVVREMQRHTHAVIKLPEESISTEEEETPVYIIGDFLSTQAAQRQIRALVSRGGIPGQRSSKPQKSHQSNNHQNPDQQVPSQSSPPLSEQQQQQEQ